MAKRVISLLLLLCCCLPAIGAGASFAAVNPLASVQLYSSHGTSAARYLAQGHADPAIERIAAQPQAMWFDSSSSRGDIAAYVRSAGARLPVAVIYNIPGRDCGSYSAGGARSAAAYRRWISMFIGAVAGRRAAVILEPDALAELRCLPHGSLSLLRSAMHTLAAQPRLTVYADAGNSAWMPAAAMTSRLRAIGAQHFALNVSNFNSTAAEAAYGQRIAAGLGPRSSFVIDTSRNGRGAAPGKQWCNPAGRALGANPTTSSAIPHVDALLWVKAPGESDGSCNGGPPAGSWWPEYARQLALNAG